MCKTCGTPNYLLKLRSLIRKDLIPKDTPLHTLDFYHDDECDIYKPNGVCDCDPDVVLNGVKIDLSV